MNFTSGPDKITQPAFSFYMTQQHKSERAYKSVMTRPQNQAEHPRQTKPWMGAHCTDNVQASGFNSRFTAHTKTVLGRQLSWQATYYTHTRA